ncbi:hypothetical protein IQ273_04440 [Nodosilinea sp. LEGE 07298]|uniref:hypothetical protein n=1 Tax=Nodosilinea sp. LEGE 07298 TaxID=2777970 RepID=UPI00187E0748|nr:hypothetical protein [Nodosilinea sp. LEGE 07298]MBE9108664.1 hypothetical protein [Nodosilinea sp. LEGE 07298]
MKKNLSIDGGFCGLMVTTMLASAFGSSAIADQPTVATVQNLIAGDRACYVDIIDVGGVYSTEYADFEICEQDLVGRDVQLTYESGTITAASCQGDPACSETETVMLITQAEIVETPTVGSIHDVIVGDRACDIGFTDETGELWYRQATFEVCDPDLVGDTAQFTYEVTEIAAYACQGEPTCEQTDVVTLITAVEVLSAAETDPSDIGDRSRVQDLPDGNYRYWNATTSDVIVSDETLLTTGGTLFLFRKQDNAINGVFSYVGEEAICVSGQVNGNTVSGTAIQTGQGLSVVSTGESFANFGPSEALSLRRGRRISSEQIRYDSALLNLAELNRINAGTVVPPGGC